MRGQWTQIVVLIFLVTVVAGGATAQQNPPPIIQALEGESIQVQVQFNPKEITIDKPVPWQKHKNSKGDTPTLEFTDAEPRTLAVELLFDVCETNADVRAAYVGKLEKLSLINEGLGRPPLVSFTWGNAFPGFKSVIENFNTRYTLFLPDGTPCRATVNLRFKEASAATVR
ncbi:MAG TPA: hypothetical protein VFY29_13475 [Terriglobia bacterium]|nr:hypothetical protein [Terriglobia bacterium]